MASGKTAKIALPKELRKQIASQLGIKNLNRIPGSLVFTSIDPSVAKNLGVSNPKFIASMVAP